MTSLKALTPQWTLTVEIFHQFLARLHPDPEQAGLIYEELRLKLLYFFEARHCAMPEALADEVLNRLMRKISEGEHIVHLDKYAFTVAKYVLLESRRGARTVTLEDCLPEDALQAAQEVEILRQEQAEEWLRSDCMKKCLAKFPPDLQQLLIEYYQGRGREQSAHRQRLAETRGLTANALYIQVYRVREKLEECLASCLEKA